MIKPPRIYQTGLHYLDIAYDPTRLNSLLDAQLRDDEVKKLAHKLIQQSKVGESVYTKLRRIQQFIHDKTYHLTREDRLELFGYLQFEEIPYKRSLINEVFSNVMKFYDSQVGTEERKQNWIDDKALNRCIGCKNQAFKERIKISFKYRGIPPLMCDEEATLAAALAILTSNISLQDVIIFGSPVHVCVFIRPTVGFKMGYIFDSKMLFRTKDMNKFGVTPEEAKKHYMSIRFGSLWFIVYSGGYINMRNKKSHSNFEKRIMKEIDVFFGIF